jgi:enoyl-CoA hydratase/carnithine racemase
MTFVRLERRGPAAWAILDRPARRNALGPEIAGELAAWIDGAAHDPDVSCFVIGAVGKAFCPGADIKASQAMVDRPAERQAFFDRVGRLIDSFSQVPVPMVAAVDGVAFAGGMELVLACDLVVAGPDARFGDLHLPHGRIPAWGAAARLAGAIGPWRAASALLLPQVYTGADMMQAGLVSMVSEAGRLQDDVQAIADHFASLDPGALRAMKRLVADQRQLVLEPLLELGKKHFDRYLAGPQMQTPPPGFSV